MHAVTRFSKLIRQYVAYRDRVGNNYQPMTQTRTVGRRWIRLIIKKRLNDIRKLRLHAHLSLARIAWSYLSLKTNKRKLKVVGKFAQLIHRYKLFAMRNYSLRVQGRLIKLVRKYILHKDGKTTQLPPL